MGGRGQLSMTAKAKQSGGGPPRLDQDANSRATYAPTERQKLQDKHVTKEDIDKAGGVVAYIAKELGVSPERAKEYADAVVGWSGSYYAPIRKYFFGTLEKNHGSWIEKSAKDLQSFIEASPKWNGGTTYRGEGGKHASALVVGQEFVAEAPASWSTSRTAASSFGKTMFICKTQSKGTSIQGFSSYANEKEVIVGRGARYRVTKIYNGTGDYSSFKYIEVEEV